MQDFNKIYELMEEAFPPEEYRSYAEQKALLEREDYHIRIYERQGELAAFCAIYTLPDFSFIEHVAVNEDFRGRGMGSEIMMEIITNSDKPIILEVEPPEREENAARRVRFYEKMGFHLHDFPYEQPPLRPGEAPLPLQLMSYPTVYDAEAFEQVKKTILHNVYGI